MCKCTTPDKTKEGEREREREHEIGGQCMLVRATKVRKGLVSIFRLGGSCWKLILNSMQV